MTENSYIILVVYQNNTENYSLLHAMSYQQYSFNTQNLKQCTNEGQNFKKIAQSLISIICMPINSHISLVPHIKVVPIDFKWSLNNEVILTTTTNGLECCVRRSLLLQGEMYLCESKLLQHYYELQRTIAKYRFNIYGNYCTSM